jgi:hypothetical protein
VRTCAPNVFPRPDTKVVSSTSTTDDDDDDDVLSFETLKPRVVVATGVEMEKNEKHYYATIMRRRNAFFQEQQRPDDWGSTAAAERFACTLKRCVVSQTSSYIT